MPEARVAIVGGGLSGLYAATLLAENGIDDYVVLEARTAFGGRIASVSDVAAPLTSGAEDRPVRDRFDLGATWFWPAMHPDLQQLVASLGLETFPQDEAGDMLIERSRAHPPSRIDGFLSAPPAVRVRGGMLALTEALRVRLPADNLVSGCEVKRLVPYNGYVEVNAVDRQGHAVSYDVAHVLVAIPPRLAANSIVFAPPLPSAVTRQWHARGTWMAPHAKYLAIYDRPFWRERGLSGSARSAVGPMVEIHDASAPDGCGALFGFLGVPAQVRRQIPEAALYAHCRAQFVRLFGDGAAMPVAEFLKDWATDSYTAIAADQDPDAQHGAGLPATVSEGPWRHRITGIASEWSPSFPGYVAGAVDAARRGVEAMLKKEDIR